MFTHYLARAAFTHLETQQDGSLKTVLQVYTALPMTPNSPAQKRLVDAIVSHMQRFPHIDRADIN